MEELAAVRRLKLEQCVSLTTYQSDASQVSILSLFFPFFIRFFQFLLLDLMMIQSFIL